MGPLYFTQPNTRVTTSSPSTNYQSTFSANSPMSQLISKIGGMLQPQQAVTDTLGYDQFATPQRNVYNEFVSRTLRPQFEYETLSPFKSQYGNKLATSNMSMMGDAKKRYARETGNLERGYQDTLSNATNAYEDMLRSAYNKRINSLSNSPTQFNNIGI